ncbi:MAG: GspH/FimT family pseudopilin [Methylobacter sp.]
MHNKSEENRGFTLIELMITISIAAILMAIAMPSFTSTIRSNRLTTYANEFVTALNLARSEAIKRGVSVSVREADNFSSTYSGVVAATGYHWENGWDVFTDVNNDGQFNGADTLLKTFPALPSSFLLRGNNNFVNFIRYASSGISNNIGSFVICDNSDGNNLPEANTSKLITVNAIGRPHLGNDADNDGIPEKDDGTEINSCISP